MAYYRRIGFVPPKRHTAHRGRTGELYFEELTGEDGFGSSSALLYHRNPPSAVLDSRAWELPDQSVVPNHPLLPRHLRLPRLFPLDPASTDPVLGRRLVAGNDDIRIAYVVAGAPSPLYRNAVGDECVYVESGRATVQSAYGSLDVGPGDYLLMPRGTTHRWLPIGELRLYCLEASSHIAPPQRYLSRYGQLLESAPYCERDLRAPEELVTHEGRDVEVFVKHRGGPHGVLGSVHTVPFHPFDLVGWDGCVYPYAFNISDFEPITGRVHQPPPAHQVFEGQNFVICNFVPRKVDYHPLSIPVPYYHANVDSDEVMFYCGGDYEARRGSGIEQASVTLHPGGHSHGPQPAAYEASIGREYFDELAVMVDTFRPLGLGEGARAVDDPQYASSWARNWPAAQGERGAPVAAEVGARP
jgi:homogentisate 1,2-dioxygenase